jgi:hypothetical protein
MRFSNIVTISTGIPKVDNEIGKILRRLGELEKYISELSAGDIISALSKHSIIGSYHLGFPEDETVVLSGKRTWIPVWTPEPPTFGTWPA